jgi:succinyl-diaminopimelate desuccinylase
MLVVTAAMREQEGVRVRLGIVGDEESEEGEERGCEHLVDSGFIGDFAITGEPTDLHIGIEAKGVLAVRLEVGGRAAHGATPWLGDNAVLNAIDVFRSIESLPFARQSSELFDRPSINLGRIWGGDALNKVPDLCVIDVDIRYLPQQDPAEIMEAVRALPGVQASALLTRPPAMVARDSTFVRTLRDAASAHHDGEPMSVGRDGASDAVSFLRVGVPAVEFGPLGAGHHGPEEWVSVASLETYRQALESFLTAIPGRLADD